MKSVCCSEGQGPFFVYARPLGIPFFIIVALAR